MKNWIVTMQLYKASFLFLMISKNIIFEGKPILMHRRVYYRDMSSFGGRRINGLSCIPRIDSSMKKTSIMSMFGTTSNFDISKTINQHTYHSSVLPSGSIDFDEWSERSIQYQKRLISLLYPPDSNNVIDEGLITSASSKTLKARQHMVKNHPIYNFLHRYYRYSTAELLKYSPGANVIMLPPLSSKNACTSSPSQLSSNFLAIDSVSGGFYYSPYLLQQQMVDNRMYKWVDLYRNYEILSNTRKRAAFLGCYGLHEWAMLYSKGNESMKRHQDSLPLRVPQSTINSVVEAGQLRCTHYDAWRFFNPDAQPMNIINPLSRESQPQYDQPGCVHANMDLFKYAYQLYPLVSSELLTETLEIALQARRIDIRASPYDSSQFNDVGLPICIETTSGRKEYVEEQEALAKAAIPVRDKLLDVYKTVLDLKET